MGDFITRYQNIMKELAEATDEDPRAEEHKIREAVDTLIDMYDDKGRTPYQLALIAIQITWWADPRIFKYQVESFGEEVPALCQEMREAEPNFKPNSPLGELLEHLEREASQALSYAGKLVERDHRRSRAGLWSDPFCRQEVPRPRVIPGSRRVILEQRQRREERLRRGKVDDDAGGGGMDEDDPQENEEYDEMETDDSEGYEDGDEDESYSSEAEGDDYAHTPTAANVSESGTEDSSGMTDDHKMTVISNDGEVVAEVSDLESCVYLKAFIEHWNNDPTAWRAQIDLWELTHGIPGRSILRCLKRDDGDGLQDLGQLPFHRALGSIQPMQEGSKE